ncbi:MAG TPA: acyl-CoA dehydrogenase, partial [Alphaproteobacteria bacterium]|nr:acyl-CoA dehydrogenase [Alphaproteobacteria bacterium]
MDFEDTPEEAEFRAQVSAWLEENAGNFDEGRDRSRPLRGREVIERSKAWQKIKADAGYAAITWP